MNCSGIWADVKYRAGRTLSAPPSYFGLLLFRIAGYDQQQQGFFDISFPIRSLYLMRFLGKLYEKAEYWSEHPKAPYYLGVVSFIDSSLFPISPLFMMLPMAYYMPQKAFWFAFIATMSSILGGILGYVLGYCAFETIVHPFLNWMGYMPLYQSALVWFKEWGFWAILLGCFSPFIPFKIFTIGAGVLQLPLGWFLMASSIGRALRFFIIAAIIQWGGPKMAPFLKRTFAR